MQTTIAVLWLVCSAVDVCAIIGAIVSSIIEEEPVGVKAALVGTLLTQSVLLPAMFYYNAWSG